MIPVLLPDQLLVRRAGPADAAAVQALVARSDLASRYSRFHGALRRLPTPYLQQLIDVPASVHDTLVVEAAGVVVGYGDLGPVIGEPGVVEIGLLVEEQWRGRGVAAVLLDELASRAAGRGATVLRAAMLPRPFPAYVRCSAAGPSCRPAPAQRGWSSTSRSPPKPPSPLPPLTSLARCSPWVSHESQGPHRPLPLGFPRTRRERSGEKGVRAKWGRCLRRG